LDDFETYHDLYSGASSVSRIDNRFEATVMGRRAAVRDRDGEESEAARRLRASLFIDTHLGR
jgi:hypothetical protein